MVFYQLERSVADTHTPKTFITEPVEMRIGVHIETSSFIVARGMNRPFVLGLMYWATEVEPLHKLEEEDVKDPLK